MTQGEQDTRSLVTVPHGRRPWAVIGAVAVVVAVTAGGASYWAGGVGRQSTNDAYLEGRVVRVSPRVAGEVVRLNVDDNTAVRAGDVLLEVDPSDYQAKVDQATAAVATADSAIQQAQAQALSAEAAVGQATAGLHAARTDERRRASDYRRYAAMGTEGISAQQLETAKASADSAADEREAAEKRLAAAAAALNVSHTAVAAAGSQAKSARAQLHLAEINLGWTKVVAPAAGRVTRKNVEAGAFVAAGQPLLAIVPDELWAVANFKEVQLTRMGVGQRAEVRVDAYPDRRLSAHVQSLQAGTGARFELLPPENATGNWVKVVQRVPVKITFDPGQDLTDLAQGMSVEVSVDTRGNEGDRS